MTIRAVLVAAIVTALACDDANAGPISFSFDTAGLVGLGDAIFAADLTDGDAISNTSITLDLFDFGGGAATGLPTHVGGASGALDGVVTLMDTTFFNSFTQPFTPGTTLAFRLDFSTGALRIPQPEGFQFLILDAGGIPLATTDPSGLNALIIGELAAARTSFQQFELAAVVVPEPPTGILLAVGVLAVGLVRRLRPHE